MADRAMIVGNTRIERRGNTLRLSYCTNTGCSIFGLAEVPALIEEIRNVCGITAVLEAAKARPAPIAFDEDDLI